MDVELSWPAQNAEAASEQDDRAARDPLRLAWDDRGDEEQPESPTRQFRVRLRGGSHASAHPAPIDVVRLVQSLRDDLEALRTEVRFLTQRITLLEDRPAPGSGGEPVPPADPSGS